MRRRAVIYACQPKAGNHSHLDRSYTINTTSSTKNKKTSTSPSIVLDTAKTLAATRRQEFAEAERVKGALASRWADGDDGVSVEAMRTASLSEERAAALYAASLSAVALAERELDLATAADQPDLSTWLSELIEPNRYELRLDNVPVVVRPRPGVDVPKVLPEVCLSQQSQTIHDQVTGIASGRVWAVVYAASADLLPDFTRQLAQLALEAGASVSVGNTFPIEELVGGVRRQYRVEIASVALPVPVLTTDVLPFHLNSLAGVVGQAIRSPGNRHGATGAVLGNRGTVASAGQPVVVSDRPVSGKLRERVVKVGINASSTNATGMAAAVEGQLVGTMSTGIGRCTKTALVDNRPIVVGQHYFEFNLTCEFRTV